MKPSQIKETYGFSYNVSLKFGSRLIGKRFRAGFDSRMAHYAKCSVQSKKNDEHQWKKTLIFLLFCEVFDSVLKGRRALTEFVR